MRIFLLGWTLFFTQFAFSNADPANQAPISQQCKYERKFVEGTGCKDVKTNGSGTTVHYEGCQTNLITTITEGHGTDDIIGIGAVDECKISEKRSDGTTSITEIAKMPNGKITKTVALKKGSNFLTLSIHTAQGSIDCNVEESTQKWTWCGVQDKFVVNGAYRNVTIGGPNSDEFKNIKKGEINLNDLVTDKPGAKPAASGAR